MSKKKDHLFGAQDIVESVLLGTIAHARCGIGKRITREDIDDTEYRDGCKDCFAVAAEETSPEAVTIRPKRGWTDVLEQAWRELHPAPAPGVTAWGTYSGGAYSYTVRVTPWDKKGGKS